MGRVALHINYARRDCHCVRVIVVAQGGLLPLVHVCDAVCFNVCSSSGSGFRRVLGSVPRPAFTYYLHERRPMDRRSA